MRHGSIVRWIASLSCVLVGWSMPLLAGFNASAPKGVRRIFTQLAFDEGRLVSYHVLEPGPITIQAFPMGQGTGKIFRFPNCPGLRPVLDDSAAPSASVNALVPDLAMREVVNVTLAVCRQPTSLAAAVADALTRSSIGFVNAPSVPAPIGAAVPDAEQQSADELWGPVPNYGLPDFFITNNSVLAPQHTLATTISGLPVSEVQQPVVRRARLLGYSAGHLVYFITYETKNLARAGLVSAAIEDQWARTGFPGERDLLFLAYGRAPLPPNSSLPAGSLDTTGVANDNQAVLNVVKGAPFWHEGDYSPLWTMHCLDGGITPTIGPGAPCGNTRFHQIGQPRSAAEVQALGRPIVDGIFRDINCPVLATDVNDDGVFADSAAGREIVEFPDIDWDGDGVPDGGIAN